VSPSSGGEFAAVEGFALGQLGLIWDGKNVNDDGRAVLRELEPFLLDVIRRQLAFGVRRADPQRVRRFTLAAGRLRAESDRAGEVTAPARG
jgi:hypothetical protein